MSKVSKRAGFTAALLATMGLIACLAKNEATSPGNVNYSERTWRILPESGSPNQNIAEIPEMACLAIETGMKDIPMSVQVTTALRNVGLTFFLPVSPDYSESLVKVDGEGFYTNADVSPLVAMVLKTCRSGSFEKRHLVRLSGAPIEAVAEVLQNYFPLCRIQFSEGWRCEHDAPHVEGVQVEINKLQNNLMKRWRRHPYMLTRRVTLTRTLAQALLDARPDEALNRLCRNIALSIDGELPAIMRSQGFKRSVCDHPSEDRQAAAGIALGMSFAEVSFLFGKLADLSRLGTLSLRLPSDANVGDDYWVSLDPVPDGRVLGFTDPLPFKSYCFDGIFSSGELELKAIAWTMGMMPRLEPGICESAHKLEEGDFKNAVAYVQRSITSESEFPVTNGRGKLLRLPVGTYRYKVLPQLARRPSQQEEQTTGLIPWEGRRPMPTIREWEPEKSN